MWEGCRQAEVSKSLCLRLWGLVNPLRLDAASWPRIHKHHSNCRRLTLGVKQGKGTAQQDGCRTGEEKAESGSLRARWGEVERKRKSKQLYAHPIIRREVYDLRFPGAGPLHSHLPRFKLNLMLLGFADDRAA